MCVMEMCVKETLFYILINDLSTELNYLRIDISLDDDRISHLLYADDLPLIAKKIYKIC